MSLSADQRDAIARVASEADGVPERFVTDEAFDNLVAAVARLFDGWLGEARRDEQERLLAELKRIDKRWTRGRNIAEKETVRALLADVRDALVFIEGSEATP